MRVRFWGTRGSIPVPGPQTLRYGGNTLCVEVMGQSGTEVILDAGSGLRVLGQHLLGQGPVHSHLFLTHTHWDHIQGFPFFVPAFVKGNAFSVYAPNGGQTSIEQALAGQMEYRYFPVRLDDLQADMTFHDLDEEDLAIGSLAIQARCLHHTVACLGYRLSEAGQTVVYSTDHEPFVWHLDEARSSGAREITHPGDRRHIEFLRGADLVIHDTQYTNDEYPTKVGWGHSPVGYVVDVAIEAGVARLALFHHDPLHSDDQIDAIVAAARAQAARQGSSLKVFGAAEGLEIDLATVAL
ncbi:MAG: MBL fold metallo-hydrolase [Chloroflexi bacterium]|nr:MBL fold metallo-hydrolase [Chloroflexota bacterium]